MDFAAAAGLQSGLPLKTNLDRAFVWAKSRFIWTPDQVAFDRPEYWATRAERVVMLTTGDGMVRDDCDGWTGLIRDTLNDIGIENNEVYCRVLDLPPDNNGHLVSYSGGYILDCRMEVVTVPAMLNYQWVSISGTKAGEPWHAIEGLK